MLGFGGKMRSASVVVGRLSRCAKKALLREQVHQGQRRKAASRFPQKAAPRSATRRGIGYEPGKWKRGQHQSTSIRIHKFVQVQDHAANLYQRGMSIRGLRFPVKELPHRESFIGCWLSGQCQ